MPRSKSSEPVALFTQLPKRDLPAPGTYVDVVMNDGYVARVWNLRKGQELDRQPKSLSFIPVDIGGTDYRKVTHAATVFRRNDRLTPGWFTLCDHEGKKVVTDVLDNEPLDSVTCKFCRKILVNEGVLDD